jgi:hypothetical protein
MRLSLLTLSALLCPLAISSLDLEGAIIIRIEATTGEMSEAEIAIFEEHCDMFFESKLLIENNTITNITSSLAGQEFTPMTRRTRILQDAAAVGVLYASTNVTAIATEPVDDFSAVLKETVEGNSDWFYISLNDLATPANITLFAGASIVTVLDAGAAPTTSAPATLAPSFAPPPTAPKAAPPTAPKPKPEEGLKPTAIIAIVVAALFGLFLLGCFAYRSQLPEEVPVPPVSK